MINQATDSITVVVPVFNGENCLGRAIASIAAQSISPSEILVVDDCSTDNSAILAASLLKNLPGGRVLRLPRNSGAGAARNTGVRAATGGFIAFLDADDEWHTNHLEVLLREIRSYGLVATKTPWNSQIFSSQERVYRIELSHLLTGNPISQSAVLIRRERFLELGGYLGEARFSEDYDLWARYFQKFGDIALVDTVTVTHYSHPNQVTNRNAREMVRNAWRVRAKLLVDGDSFENVDVPTVLKNAFQQDLLIAWHLRDQEFLKELEMSAEKVMPEMPRNIRREIMTHCWPVAKWGLRIMDLVRYRGRP